MLRCDVEVIKPKLNFGLRFQAGYNLQVPLVQYSGAGHVWKIEGEVLRVYSPAEFAKAIEAIRK